MEDDRLNSRHPSDGGRASPLGAPGNPIPKKVGLAAIDFDSGTLILTEQGTQKRRDLAEVRIRRRGRARTAGS